MIKLWDNAFSPFARKVRMVLEYKGLAHEAVDGLARPQRDALERVNGRVEVPALEHDGHIIVNSADIVGYLERVFPDRPVYPADHGEWVRARAWERCSDTLVDAIVIDVSYWIWAEREDSIPVGLLERARADFAQIYAALERDLDGRDFLCGAISVADIALFPHLSATRMCQVPFDGDRYPRLLAYYKRLRAMDLFAADLARTKFYLKDPAALDIERRKIFWRGDRIEWMLAAGQHDWFASEIAAGRVIWPGLAIPA